jgi:hypothetical protein
MPAEYEFMKSSREKEMPDGEYKSQRDEYDKKTEELIGRIKKTLISVLIILTLSFAAIYIFCIFAQGANSGQGVGNYTWLFLQYLLAIFFYGLKPEDIRQKNYETDKKILLAYAKNKITAFKIRFGLVIGISAAFAFLHILCWWLAVTNAALSVVD